MKTKEEPIEAQEICEVCDAPLNEDEEDTCNKCEESILSSKHKHAEFPNLGRTDSPDKRQVMSNREIVKELWNLWSAIYCLNANMDLDVREDLARSKKRVDQSSTSQKPEQKAKEDGCYFEGYHGDFTGYFVTFEANGKRHGMEGIYFCPECGKKLK